MLAPLLLALLAAEPSTSSHNVASVEPLSLLGLGLVVQGEHYLADDRWSIAANLGGRDDGWGDYQAFSFSAGVQVRRFLWRPGGVSRLRTGERLGGLLAYVQVEAAFRVLRMGGHAVAGGVQVTPSAGVGFRFLPWSRLEVTPYVGVGPRLALGGSELVVVRPNYGVTLGWVF